jgi:hypothetical protein
LFDFVNDNTNYDKTQFMTRAIRNIFILITLWLSVSSFTEDPIKISVKDILSGVQKERRMVSSLQSVDYLKRLNYRLPILKDLGLKYGTDDLTNSKRQYSASFGFNTFKIIKEQQSIKAAQLSVYEAKKDLVLSQVVQERYINIIDIYFSQNILSHQRLLDTFLNKKNEVLKTSLKKGIPIKVKDLVETEDDIRGLRLLAAEMDNIRLQSLQRVKDYMGVQNPFTLVTDNWVTVSKIEDILNAIKTNKNYQTAELKISQSRMNLSQAELRLEEASFKQFFDGFQLIYEHKSKTELTTQDFSFRVGFNIPLKGNLRPKQNELLLDIKEAENAYQMTFYETDRQTKTQILRIENLIKQYRLCSETLNTSLSNNLLNNPSVLGTLAPSDIIDLRIIQQKKNIELTKTQYELMKEYVKLLDLTGDLTFAPYRNFLSNSLEKW